MSRLLADSKTYRVCLIVELCWYWSCQARIRGRSRKAIVRGSYDILLQWSNTLAEISSFSNISVYLFLHLNGKNAKEGVATRIKSPQGWRLAKLFATVDYLLPPP